jgi:hypothetical protein
MSFSSSTMKIYPYTPLFFLLLVVLGFGIDGRIP